MYSRDPDEYSVYESDRMYESLGNAREWFEEVLAIISGEKEYNEDKLFTALEEVAGSLGVEMVDNIKVKGV